MRTPLTRCVQRIWLSGPRWPEPAERAWELAVVLMAANQAISYLSLASSIDPPNQEMAAAAGQWLRRLITSASELTHRRTQPAHKDGQPSAGDHSIA